MRQMSGYWSPEQTGAVGGLHPFSLSFLLCVSWPLAHSYALANM